MAPDTNLVLARLQIFKAIVALNPDVRDLDDLIKDSDKLYDHLSKTTE